MGRVKTFSNGGSLLPGDLNSIEDDYESAFSTYKDMGGWIGGQANFGGTAAGNYMLGTANLYIATNSDVPIIWLKEADRTANARVTKYRVRGYVATNAVAPGCTFTIGLYPLTYTPGAAGSNGGITLGAVVAGSTIAVVSAANIAPADLTSGDFTAPASGAYALGFAISGGTQAATNRVDIRAVLQQRQV